MWVDPARPKPIWRGDYYHRLLADPAWVCEPKWDGYRCLVWTDETGSHCWSRHKRPIANPPHLPALPVGSLLDGEWMRNTRELVVWDAPVIASIEVDWPLAERWAWVCDHVPELGPFRRTVRLTGDPWDRAMRMGAEGVVLKGPGPYPRGDTFNWLKVKG